MDLGTVFKQMLALKRRLVNIERGASTLTGVYISPSDYQRNLAGPGATEIRGREFIVSKDQLKSPITSIRRGDVIVDSELGALSVSEVIEMYSLGGAILAYRIRTN